MAELAKASKPVQKLLKLYSNKLLFSLVVFSLVISGSIAGPRGTLNIPKCVSFCTESSKFHFATTSTYIYDYSTDVSTYVVHGSSGESRIHLKAKVEITPISQCDFEMKLKDVQLEESELENSSIRTKIKGSDLLVEELEQRPLQFTYQNGKIETLCSDEEDSVWNLNVKRGILSMLQNNADKGQQMSKTIQEIDVNGKCPTTYSTDESDATEGIQLIHKTKNLKSCNHRHSHISGIQSVSYSSNSPIQSIPLLSGTQNCTQTIKNDKITHVECNEEHNFQPFDYIKSGARTKVSQKLSLSLERPASEIDQLNTDEQRIRRSSLLFESETSSESNKDEIDGILKLMENLEEKNMVKIKSNAPEYFMELIDQLRSINLHATKLLYSKASDVGKLFLLDAQPFVGTPPSLDFMTELLLENKLSESQIEAWLTSLSFIKNPSIEMIEVLQPLLNGNPNSAILFGISSMINSYCQVHEECNSNEAIVNTLRKIYTLLDNCDLRNISVNSHVYLKAIYALKSIGNAGRFVKLGDSDPNESNSFHLIEKCFRLKSNPIEIRLAAIDSFRRMPCGSYNHHSLVQHLKNIEENTEVRIQAYLTLMKCPNNELVEIIKDVFYTDPVNQVVSFMWTHLTNLQETSSPDKQALRELLSNDVLKNKFSSDVRKFSRNFEGSKYWEEYNVGAGYDANLIFTPDSFIPRSGMVNITSHFFGESINLLEFGVRVHSMEQLLEPIFGPAGYFPDQSVNQALHSMRVRRDANNNRFDRLSTVYDQAALDLDEPGGSFYTRVFGNEITSKSFKISHQDKIVPTMIDENGKNWFDLTYWLDNLNKGKSMDFTKSNILMDMSYTVPTSAGLPLTLNIQSATTVGVKANGRVYLERFWEHKELEISGKLNPSAAIQVIGTMSVNLGSMNSKIQSGLRIENTLHSSTSVEGKVQLKNGKLVHASIGLPQDKQEVFQAKSQLHIVRPSGEKILESGPRNALKIEHKYCTSKYVETLLGIKICSDITIPETSFFQTPTSASIHIQKTDTFKNYEFDYKWEHEADKTDIELIFNTPGSKINRRVAANYNYDWNAGLFKLGIETPTKSLIIDGNYLQNSPHFQLSASSNNQRILFVNAELKRLNARIEPKFIILYFEKPIVEIDGSTINMLDILNGDGKARFDLNLKHLTQSRININGELTRIGDAYDSDVSLTSYLITGNLKSQLRLNENLLITKLDTQYSLKGAEMISYSVNGKIQKSQVGLLSKYYTIFNFNSIDKPENDFGITWELQSGGHYCENNLKITLGKEIWNGKTLFSNQLSRTHKDFRVELLAEIPRYRIDYNFLISHQEADNGFTSKCVVKLNSQNEFKAHVGYLLGGTRLLKRNFLAGFSWNDWLDYSVRGSVDENKPGEYDAEIIINSMQQKSEMKGTVSYKNRSSNTRIDHSIEFRTRGFNDWPTASGTATFVASEKLSHIGGQLDIAGSEYYNGKWSGSLNYSAPKKNSRKVEGKLTINELKYNGVLNYKKIRNGDRTFIVDLHLHKHIFMETKLTGYISSVNSPLNIFIVIIPDQNNYPEAKISSQSIISSKSLNINLDYFGKTAQFNGIYDKKKGQIEIQWLGNKQLGFSFDVSKLSLKETIFMIELESPIQNIGVSLQHTLTHNKLSTQFSGHLNEQKSSMSVNGNLGSSEAQISIIAEIDQLKRLQTQLKMFRTGHQLILDFNNQLGDEASNLKLVHVKTEDGCNSQLEFDGCSFIPKSSITFSHQMSTTQFVDLDIKWVSIDDGVSRKINLRLEGEQNPWNYNFKLTTPWSPLDKLEIGMLTELDPKLIFEFTISGSHYLMPIAFKLSSDRNLLNSHHEMNVWWTNEGKIQSIKSHLSNRFESWKNAEFQSELNIFEHKYKLDLTSKKQKHVHEVELKLFNNNNEFNTGASWQCEKRGNLVKVSAWTQYPNQPKFRIDYRHLNDDKYFILDGHVKEADKILGQIITEFHSTGFEHWEVTAKLNSVLNFIPTVSFTSHHSIEDLNEIRHSTEFILTESNLKLWGGLEESKILLTFNLKNGKDLSGSIKLNEKEIKLIGTLENESSSEEDAHIQLQKVDLEISSKLFDSIQATAEYKVDYNSIEIGFSGLRKGKKFIGLSLDGKNDKYKHLLYGHVNILCPFGHQIEGTGQIDFKNKLLQLSLAETKQQSLNFVINGQAKSQSAYLNLSLDSKISGSLNNIRINTNYKTEAGQYELEGKYKDDSGETSLNSVWIWRNKQKKFQLLLNKSDKLDFNIELLDNEKFATYITFDKEQLFNLDVKYKVESNDEFKMGKHIIDLTFNHNDTSSCQLIGVLGLDPNHLMLNFQTPFEGWDNWTFDTKIAKSASTATKTVTVLLFNGNNPESEKYNAKFEYGDHLMTVALQTPFRGLSNIEANLKYNFDNGLATSFDGIWESKKISMSTIVTKSNVEFLIQSPFEHLQHFSASMQWNLRSSVKTFELLVQANKVTHQISGEWELEFSHGHAKVLVNTPLIGNYKLGLKYDLLQNVEAQASFQVGNAKPYELSIKLVLGDDQVQFDVLTPFKGYENIIIKIHYTNSNGGQSHSGVLEWSINGKSTKVSVELNLQPGKVELRWNTPIKNWTQMTATLLYNIESNKKVIELHLEKEQTKYIEIKNEIITTGDLTNWNKNSKISISMNIDSAILPGYENIDLFVEYERTKSNQQILSIQTHLNNVEIIESKLNYQLQKSTNALAMDINGEISAPIFDIQLSSLNGSFKSEFSSNEKTLELILIKKIGNDNKQYNVKTSYQWTPTLFKLEVQTPFKLMKNLQIDLHYEVDGRLGGVLELNKKRIGLNGQLNWNGFKNFMLTTEISTPFTNYKSIHAQINSKICSNTLLIDYILQNDNVRFMGKIDGSFDSESGSLKIQLNSPISKLEQILSALYYNTSGIYTRVERNTKEEINGFISFINSKLEVNFKSKLPNYPIDAQSIIELDHGILPSIKININANIFGPHSLLVSTNINGLSFGEVNLNSSVSYLDHLKLKWEMNGNLNGGEAKLSWDVVSFGSKSFRTSWKNENFNGVKLEFWFNSPLEFEHEKGFSLQYNLFSPGDQSNGKFSGTFTYILENKEEQVTISTALKKSGKTHTMELVLATPFELLNHLTLSGRFVSNPEVILDISATHNQVLLFTSNVVTFISPLTSKLKFSLHAPLLSDEFHLNVGYDLTTIDKTFDISFIQNKYQLNVKAQAIVPNNPDEIELRMTVDSNVPSVTVSASGSLRAGYKIQADETRQIIVSINSEQTGLWKITTSIKLVPSNFNINFKVDSPIPDKFPSIQSEIKCIGSIARTIDAELFIHVGKFQPIKSTLRLSYQNIHANFKSGIHGLEDIGFDGILESHKKDMLNHKFHFGIKLGESTFSTEGDIQIPTEGHYAKGSIKLNSTWDHIPNASLDVNAATNGTIIISGMLGSNKINIRSNIRKNNIASPSWNSATADISLSINAEEIFHIQSNHFFNNVEQSLNLTMSDDYKLETYFKTNPQFNTFSSNIQWSTEKQVNFRAEMGSGRFNASIKTPWTSDIFTHGEYKVNSEEYSGKGTCTIDGQKSSIEAIVQTTHDVFKSRISVDVPLLSQKLLANVKIIRPDEHYTEGSVDLKMKDRRIALKGALASNIHRHADNTEMDEKLLKLSISLPIRKYSEMSGEFSWKTPTNSLSRLQLESSVTVGLHTAKGRFHFQLPMHGSKILAAGLMLDAPILSPEKYEWLLDISDINPLHFNGQLQYKLNNVAVSWDIEENFSAKLSANLPTILSHLNPISLEGKGQFKSNEMHLRTIISWPAHAFTTQISALNTPDNLSLRVFAHAPSILVDSSEITIKLQKIDDSLFHRILDVTASHGKDSIGTTGEFNYESDSISTSLKLSGYYGTHFIQISTNQIQNIYEIGLNAESMTLLKGKKMNIVGRVEMNKNEFDAIIECRTRQSTHSISSNIKFNSQNGIFSIKLESPYVKPINFETEYKFESNSSALHAKLSANFMSKSHVVKFGYDLNDLEAYLSIVSPLMTSQIFNIHLKSKLKQHIDILADFHLFDNEWKFETKGIYSHNHHLEVKFEIKTPYEAIHRVTLETILSSNKIHLEFYTPIDELPNFVISLIDVPLFEGINLMDFKPQIVVGLPWVTYAASALVQLPSKTRAGEISFMIGHGDPASIGLKEFKFAIQISPFDQFSLIMDERVQVIVKVSTPFQHFKSFECGFGGRINLRSWSEINLNGELNGKEIGLTTEVQREEATKKFVVTFKTPFRNFEHTSFSIRVEKYEEIGTGRNIQLDFEHSSWDKPIHTEIDYHYRISESLLNMDGELTLHLPDSQLPPIFIRVQSGILDTSYSGIIEGRWGQWAPLLKVNGGFTHERLFGSVEAQLGENTGYQVMTRFDFRQQIHEISLVGEMVLGHEQIIFANIGFVQKLDVVKCNVFFKTPMKHFSSISGELRISPLSRADSIVTLEKLLHTLDVNLGITFNEFKLFKFELVSKNNQRSLEIHNPIQPISFIISYKILPNKKLQVISEFCWDLANPSESTIGVNLNYAKNPFGSDILLKIQGGDIGTFELDTSHLWSNVKLEQNLQLNWNSLKLKQDISFGYYILHTDEFISTSNHHLNNLILRLDLPWRSIQTEHQKTISRNANKVSSTTNMEFKWDVAKDPSKRIGMLSTYDTVTVRRVTTKKCTHTLIHSGFRHNLAFETERVYKHNKLWETELIFKPNNFIEDQFTIRWSHENIKGSGIQIMITHPSTNIDINTILSVSDTSSLFYLAYLNVRGERHVIHLEKTASRHKQHYLLSSGSNVNQLTPLIQFDIENKEDDFEQIISLKTPILTMDSNVRTDLPYLHTSLRFDPDSETTLSIGLTHKKKMILQILRNEFGQNIQDLFIVAKFNNSDMLSTGLFWRPEMFHELHEFVTTKISGEVVKPLNAMIFEGLGRFNEEVEERLKIIDPGVERAYDEFVEHAYKEVNFMYSEVEELIKYVEEIHNQNKLYTKDLLKLIGKAFDRICNSCSIVSEFAQQLPFKLAYSISKVYEKLRELSKHYSGNLESTVMNAWKSVEIKISNLWLQYTKRIDQILQKGQKVYETFMAAIEGNMDILEERIYGVGFIRKLFCLYEDYASWLQELPIQGYLNHLRDLFKQNILQPLETYYNPYFAVLNRIIEDGNLYALLDIPPVPYVRYMTTGVLNTSARFWKFIEAEQRIRDLVGEILGRVNDLIQRHLPLSKINFEIEKGHIEYHQPLTFIDWEDFTKLPKWKVPENDADDISHIAEIGYSILDIIRSTQPFVELDFRKILPPFSGTAIMSGDNHYITFDKKYYRFVGECSYVLLADLAQQNYTLVVNYENHERNLRKKSYTLLNGDKVIEIDARNYKVTIDGRKTELPLQVGSTFIRKQPSGIEIFDSRGIHMQCSMTTHVCAVSVSGWYFGKLGGLLGTYDNEPNNDLQTPNGKITRNVAEFAYSWRVGQSDGQCRARNFARELAKYQDVEGICHEHLVNLNSPLRACFNVIPTQPFLDMCKYDTTLNLNSVFRRESACSAISAYVTECQKNGVDLWMPTACVQCQLEDGSSIASGENVTVAVDSYVKPPMSSDIVILIEETKFLKDFNLNVLLNKLENSLRVEGLSNNRYAVIGFGGLGPYRTPHIRTSSGQVWTTSTLVKISDMIPMDGDKNGDLYEAIDYGSTIGFRAGVSKTIIAVIADDESSVRMNREYSDTFTLLIENDIKFHILSPKDIILKGNKRDDGNKLFGFDRDGVFTLWQSKRGSLESDKALKRYTILPKDYYTPLAFETTGTRFNLNFMNSSLSKTFLDVWSRLVAKSSQPSKCQRCECVPNKFGGSRIMCEQCVSPAFKLFLETWDDIKLDDETISESDNRFDY